MTNCFTCIISLALVSITQCDICVISLINARNLYIFSSSYDTNEKLILSCTVCICEILTNSYPHDHMISFHMINRICPNVAFSVNIIFQWHSVFYICNNYIMQIHKVAQLLLMLLLNCQAIHMCICKSTTFVMNI